MVETVEWAYEYRPPRALKSVYQHATQTMRWLLTMGHTLCASIWIHILLLKMRG
jgi:hypothetical protein